MIAMDRTKTVHTSLVSLIRLLAGPSDPIITDSVWPLSQICSWVIEFSENVLSVANEYNSHIQTQAKEGSPSNGR